MLICLSRCLLIGDGTAGEGSTLEQEQQSAAETIDDGLEPDRWGRVPLGRKGWRICLTMGFLPCALPCRASEQHKKLTELYPVESTLKSKVGALVPRMYRFPYDKL